MSLELGSLDGKYEILHKISEGGMGAIYKVRHLLLDEVRVIKVIHPRHAEDEEVQQRFHLEARTAIRLRHPHIAHLYDFTLDPRGDAYIILEFIDGLTLVELLKKRGVPELGLGLEIASQGLRALGYLHRRGYLHRDVSPDNLMLTRTFDGGPLVKMIDLGIAKRLDVQSGLTVTGIFMGKVRYSSPEQFRDQDSDPRSDLYSFGVLFYELLTGVLPIRGESVSELVAGHLFKPPRGFDESDPEGKIPAGLRELLLGILEKDPDQRPATAEEIDERLEEYRRQFPWSTEDLDQTVQIPALGAATAGSEEPTSLSGAVPEAVATAAAEEIAVVAGEIGAMIEAECLEAAGERLADAVSQLGDAKDFQRLRIRLEAALEALVKEPRERGERGSEPPPRDEDVDEKEVSVHAEEIENLLSASRLREAGEQLADAVARQGENESFHHLHLRLEDALAVSERESRVQEIERRLAKASKCLEGDLPRARRETEEVLRLDPESTDAARLLGQVEELEAKVGEKIEALIAAARGSLEEGELTTAASAVRQAIDLDSGNRQAHELGAEIEAQRQTAQKRQSRESIRGELALLMEKLFSEGDLVAAGHVLSAAERDLGPEDSVLGPLRQRLAEEIKREEEREQRLRKLLAASREHLRANEPEKALESARLVLGIDPRRREAEDLVADCEAMLKRRRQNLERTRPEVATLVEHLVSAGDLSGARAILTAAKHDLGSDRILEGLQSQVEEEPDPALAKPVETDHSPETDSSSSNPFRDLLQIWRPPPSKG